MSCLLLVEETDGLSSGLSMKRETQPRNEVTCNALAEMITMDWYIYYTHHLLVLNNYSGWSEDKRRQY